VTTTYTPNTLTLDQLLLDPNNYRFQDQGSRRTIDENRFHEQKVQDSAWQLVRDDGVLDLKSSILANGFLPVERIVVKKYQGPLEDRYVVLEGNRRLAALRWIKADHDNGQTVDSELLTILEELPVIEVETEDPSVYLSIMGVRHVGGIKEWGGYQSAKLVAELKDVHSLDTQEVASRLGLGPVEVNRRYRAFKALEQMRQDEEYGDLASPDHYVLFFEAIASPRIKAWVDWSESRSRFENEENAREFYRLISATTDEDGESHEAKISKYLEVRELKYILDNPVAMAALSDPGRSFSDASAIAKADGNSGSWRSAIKAALKAIDGIGARELRELSDDDRALIVELADTASLAAKTSLNLAGNG
jgi:hypothetical protein